MKTTVASRMASTVDELIAALHSLGPQRQIGGIYTTINSDAIKVSLVEEILVDGSILYHYDLSEACK